MREQPTNSSTVSQLLRSSEAVSTVLLVAVAPAAGTVVCAVAACWLSRCVRLRVLDLSFNSIRSIEGLDALGDLRELRLSNNRIADIPLQITCLSKLRVFLLDKNGLEDLPRLFGRLHTLRRLELQENMFEALPARQDFAEHFHTLELRAHSL